MSSRLIVLEGMPGAGKTTLANHIDPLTCCVVEQLVLKDAADEQLETSIQYIDAELARTQKAIFTSNVQTILLDRNVIGTLAFRYAKSAMQNKESEYIKLLNYYKMVSKQAIKPDLLIIMDVSIEQSLARRLDHSQNPIFKTWFDRNFLIMLRNFYRDHIPEICIGKNNLYIDTTDLLPEQVATDLRTLIIPDKK